MDVQMFRRQKYLLLLAATCCWLLLLAAAFGCCCWPLLLARLRGIGLPCGAVGMGPRAVRLEALVLAKLVRRRLPDDLHCRVENLERALEHGEAGWWGPGSWAQARSGWVDEYDGDVRLVAACLQLAGQRSLAWRANSSSSVRVSACTTASIG